MECDIITEITELNLLCIFFNINRAVFQILVCTIPIFFYTATEFIMSLFRTVSM